MPPGYKPRDQSPPSDLKSESYLTSAETPSQFSTKRTDRPDLEALGSDRDPEHRFGRQVSNEWIFYPSDTNSRSSVTLSHSSTYPPVHAPRPDIYSHTYSHPAGPAPLRELSSENDNQVTVLKKDKRHLKHKVTKLEIKVVSLEGELASANKLYKQLLEPHNVVLGYRRIRPAEVDKSTYHTGQPIVGRPMACSCRVWMG
ncbi:hypothetical protein PAXRUDRAFT_175573 [Paxillus rubicundulus Ve08.2h10]|uniref:Uncharacterized protein n=1 Tax=Paxillus rubicundulus Ve08.2h10 TaxID=930991 RepID=A0A0D0D3I5_9AGAM|nr:hypothetical protein PAXRUDRAFT_175573 [Paxillus rubicundulus Ve08.2h10]